MAGQCEKRNTTDTEQDSNWPTRCKLMGWQHHQDPAKPLLDDGRITVEWAMAECSRLIDEELADVLAAFVEEFRHGGLRC
jgi:hypothetical protein